MLSRGNRLRKARDFRAVFSGRGRLKGTVLQIQRAVSNDLLTLHCGKRRISGESDKNLPKLRFGFTISKKTAKRAHDRNRIKRRLSEVARLEIVPAYHGSDIIDCVVVARSGTVTADYKRLRDNLVDLCAAAGFLTRDISVTTEQ